MPHHYIHDDLLEEYDRDLKMSRKGNLMRCTRCGDPIRGVHYVGKDASGGEGFGRPEGSDKEIRVCPHCYNKNTGLNIGQFREEYEA